MLCRLGWSARKRTLLLATYKNNMKHVGREGGKSSWKSERMHCERCIIEVTGENILPNPNWNALEPGWILQTKGTGESSGDAQCLRECAPFRDKKLKLTNNVRIILNYGAPPDFSAWVHHCSRIMYNLLCYKTETNVSVGWWAMSSMSSSSSVTGSDKLS